MEGIGSRDSDGVCGPDFKTWVVLFGVERDGGEIPKMVSRQCGCNVLRQASMVLEESKWLVGRDTQAERAVVDAQSCLCHAVVWVIVALDWELGERAEGPC